MINYRLSKRMKKILLFLRPLSREVHRDLIIKFVEGCRYRYVCIRIDRISCPYLAGEKCPLDTLYIKKTTRRYSGYGDRLKPQIRVTYARTFKRMRELNLLSVDKEHYGYSYGLTLKGWRLANKLNVEKVLGEEHELFILS